MDDIIDIDEIFLTIKNNISNNDIIDNYINYICDNFNNIDYDDFIQQIIQNLNNELVIVSFINPLMNKLYTYKKVILNDIINLTSDLTHLKNLFIIDFIGYDILFNILKYKNMTYKSYSSILEFIYNIGKKDIIIKIINYLFKQKLNYEIIFNIILAFISFHKILSPNTNDYKQITSKLLDFINVMLYPLFELNELIITTFQNNNIFLTEENINVINEFLSHIIINKEYYYDILIIKNCTQFIDILIRNKLYDKTYNIINELTNLLNNDLLNIHDKTSLLLRLIKFITDDGYNNIPQNMLYNINYYLSNIKFLEFSTFEEKINILFLISKLLFKIYKYNLLDNQDNKLYCNMLYNLFYYEKESFTIIEYVLKNEILFTTYTLIKETIYGLITVLNIFVEIEIFICNKLNINCNYVDYDYILYKNNLNTTSYISFISTNDKLYKFNTNIMIHNFMISKYIILFNQLEKNRLPYIGLEYSKLKEYYNKYNIRFSDLFINKLNELEQKFNDTNDYMDKNPESNNIDSLFMIKIETPYKLPKSNETYEKISLRLLIRDTNKNPFTREIITLEELDNYNS